eukprot:754762-Hanusia_phi.AAC.2
MAPPGVLMVTGWMLLVDMETTLASLCSPRPDKRDLRRLNQREVDSFGLQGQVEELQLIASMAFLSRET